MLQILSFIHAKTLSYICLEAIAVLQHKFHHGTTFQCRLFQLESPADLLALVRRNLNMAGLNNSELFANSAVVHEDGKKKFQRN